MERKDYLIRYFEMLGQVMARLMGFKRRGDFEAGIEEIDQTLNEALKVDLSLLESIEPSKLMHELIEKRNFGFDQLKFLGELVYERAEFFSLQNRAQQANSNYCFALEIFEHIDRTSGVYSSEQMTKIETIKGKIIV
jgi:hypothetical protein